MNRQAYYGPSTTIASDADWGPLGPTLGEISAVIDRRLSWYGLYGLSSMTLDAVELKDGKAIVAYLSHPPNTAYREVIDLRTGRLVKREVLQTRSARASVEHFGTIARGAVGGLKLRHNHDSQ